MDRIEDAVERAVGRIIGPAAVGVLLAAAWLMGDPARGLMTAAVGCLLLAVLLAAGARTESKRPYRRTKAWRLMGRRAPIPENRVQDAIGAFTRKALRREARAAFRVALALWLVSLVLRFAPSDPAAGLS